MTALTPAHADEYFAPNYYGCGENANATVGLSAAVSGNWLYLGGAGQVQVFQFQPASASNPFAGWFYYSTITSPTGSTTDGFGSVIALDGATLVIGAPMATVANTPNVGRAFVFDRTFLDIGGHGGYVYLQTAELTAPSTTAANFGSSVAISGDTVVVGEPNLSYIQPSGKGGIIVYSEAGGAAIYQRNSGGTNAWGRTGTIAGSSESGDHFGAAVAISGTALLIGAPDAPVTPAGQSTINGGRGYFFTLQPDGTAIYNLYVGAQTPAANHKFGAAVAINSSIAVIGAPYGEIDQNSDNAYPSVDIYVANGSGGYAFSDSTFRGLDTWAHSIAVAGTDIAVGFVYNGFEGVDLLQRHSTGWQYSSLPQHASGAAGALGGTAVAYDGTTLVSGAPHLECGDVSNTSYGGAFIYTQDTIFENGFDAAQ